MNFRYRQVFFLATLPVLAVGLLSWAAGAGAASKGPSAQSLPVRWAFYITYNPNSLVSLKANVKGLNYVSPWFYYVNRDGQVTGSDQTAVSTLLRQNGVKSLPMIKNDPQYNDFTAILTDTAKTQAIIDTISAKVAVNRYDGITVDFEGLNPADKGALTSFMGRLYDRLHSEGKLVAMAVAAKVRDTDSGWAAPYDYSALAPVVDYMLVMAYDYHWSTSDPGAVAPLGKLRDTAAYTVSRFPAGKVIWGVGVYGYDWPTDGAGAGTGKAEYRNYAEAQALAAQPGAQSGYSESDAAPWVRYTRDSVAREIWYEDRRSFSAKLDIIYKYGFAGFGIWRLGQEDPGIWDIIAGNPLPASTPTPPGPTPTPRPPAACLPVKAFQSSTEKVFFAPTGHSLAGIFLRYWQAHGGLPVYGYPLTEEFTEVSKTDSKPYRVQYFERNRFEYHPENAPPNDVQLGLLGVQALGNRNYPAAGAFDTGPQIVYFPQVGHTLSGAFLDYWQRSGGLEQFGYPISEPVLEEGRSGKAYTVQYTERARFEIHPEYAGTSAEVLLGLLGLNVLPCR